MPLDILVFPYSFALWTLNTFSLRLAFGFLAPDP